MKRATRRLSLARDTVRVLSSTDLSRAAGGDPGDNPTNAAPCATDFSCDACRTNFCSGWTQQPSVYVGPCVTGLCQPF